MLEQVINYGRMIKFSHSVFALPFALSGALFCYAVYPDDFTWEKLIWIIVAMVSARSAAMGFNRYTDKEIDAKNPRTSSRELPRGIIKKNEALAFIIFFISVFIFSAYMLNPLAFALSPVALAVILGYSFTKKFTRFSHLVLGLGLGLAPLGAWIALAGRFDILPIILALAVTFWVAGFDIIYSCQDYEFDLKNNLFSLPAALGIKKALWAARGLHGIAGILFLAVGFLAKSTWIYFAGAAVIFLLMIYQHRIVSEKDLTKVDMAFFNLNGTISVWYFIIVILDKLVKNL
jgi:4-hydroxybenzoate polyprenyltransferase